MNTLRDCVQCMEKHISFHNFEKLNNFVKFDNFEKFDTFNTIL